MNNPRMLYKFPGAHDIHGGKFDYTIVDEDAVEAALAEGWSLTTGEAKAAHEAAVKAKEIAEAEAAEKAAQQALADENKPPTRAELEQMAKSLALPFDGRTSDKKLAALIAAKTGE